VSKFVADLLVRTFCCFVGPKVISKVEGGVRDARYRRNAESRRKVGELKRELQARESTKGAALTARTEAPAEIETDGRFATIQVGISASEVEKIMGRPSSTDHLGARQLWNYSCESLHARWQVLLSDDVVIGTYTRGAYRFAKS